MHVQMHRICIIEAIAAMKSDKLPVDKKLLLRLRMFAVIFLVVLAIGIYDVVVGNLHILLALAACTGGLLIGLVVGRVYNVSWNEDAGKVMGKMDALGVAILIAYVAFAFFRKEILAHWLTGHQLSGFIIWLYTGLISGRFITLRRMVIKVLKGRGEM